jgi:hypothetical protein
MSESPAEVRSQLDAAATEDDPAKLEEALAEIAESLRVLADRAKDDAP